jgi:hypothetical protein
VALPRTAVDGLRVAAPLRRPARNQIRRTRQWDTVLKPVAESKIGQKLMTTYRYLRQDFREVARRRAAEARNLLPVKKRADGAATCALLAAECALKALLLDGLQLDYADGVQGPVKAAFSGRAGHDLAFLWTLQHQRISSRQPPEVSNAIGILSKLDRYAHRYGAVRTTQTKAQEAVKQADIIVSWMSEVVT